MFHTLREKTWQPQRDGGVLCRRHPSAGLPDARAVCPRRSASRSRTPPIRSTTSPPRATWRRSPAKTGREVRLQTAGKFNAYYHDNEQALREAMDALAGRFSPEELDAAERVMQALVQTVETEKGD